MTFTIVQILRVAAVIALLGIAAAIVTPKGWLPLALCGIFRALGKPVLRTKDATIPIWKRIVAFLLVFTSFVLAMI